MQNSTRLEHLEDSDLDDNELKEHLSLKVQEISELIVKRGLIRAVNGLRKTGAIGEKALDKLRHTKIDQDYSSEISELLLLKRCGCKDLVERVRKELVIRALHDHCTDKFSATSAGNDSDPMKFFKSRYAKLFKQLDLPDQYAMKKIDPNLYTYFYKKMCSQKKML